MKSNKKIILAWMVCVLVIVPIAYGALTDDNIHYYEMDTSGQVEDAIGNLNGTLTGMDFRNGGGIINSAYQFTDPGDQLNYALETEDLYAISFWTNESVQAATLKGIGTLDAAGVLYLSIGPLSVDMTDETISLFHSDGGSKPCNYIKDTASGWSHIVLNWNATSTQYDIFLNGAKPTQFVCAGPDPVALQTEYDMLWSTAAFQIDQSLDEISLWNRSLTFTEIEDLYNSGNGLQYPYSSDIIVTDINCTSPNPDQDTEPFHSNDNTTTFTLTTNTNANCFISDTNSSFNNCTTTGGTQNHVCTLNSTQELPDTTNGSYGHVFFNCSDLSGTDTYNRSEIYIDTTNPTVTIDSPLNGTSDTTLTQTINITCTDYTNVANITFTVAGTVEETNTTPVNNTPWSFSYTFGGYTTYNMTAECWDNITNYNQGTSSITTFTITAPGGGTTPGEVWNQTICGTNFTINSSGYWMQEQFCSEDMSLAQVLLLILISGALYVFVYRRNCLIGSIAYTGIGIAIMYTETTTIADILGFIMTMTGLISIIYCIFSKKFR